MDKKEICFHVGTHNCAESNLFLRKFYEVISGICFAFIRMRFFRWRLSEKAWRIMNAQIQGGRSMIIIG